jgi:hypothetical protein
MGIINSIRLGLLASLVAVPIAGSPALAQQPKKPNIVLVREGVVETCSDSPTGPCVIAGNRDANKDRGLV